jgi:hypothetical protein
MRKRVQEMLHLSVIYVENCVNIAQKRSYTLLANSYMLLTCRKCPHRFPVKAVKVP